MAGVLALALVGVGLVAWRATGAVLRSIDFLMGSVAGMMFSWVRGALKRRDRGKRRTSGMVNGSPWQDAL